MENEVVVVTRQHDVVSRTREQRTSTSSLCPNHRKSTPTRWKKKKKTKSSILKSCLHHYSSSHNSSFLSIFAIVSFIVINIFCLSTSVNSGLVLNSFIRHYEPAYFSKEHLAHQRATTNVKAQLHKKSSRRKRETHSQFYEKEDDANFEHNFRTNERYHKPITFNFTAHNRLFKVTIRQDAQSVFADDVIFENSLGPIDFNKDSVYSGFLEDLPSSSVQGIVTEEGHFDGHISTPTDHFYIEPATRYFPAGTVDFHSVIYSSKDVVHPSSLSEKPFETRKRETADNDVSVNDSPTCKSHELYLKMTEERKGTNKADCVHDVVHSDQNTNSQQLQHNYDWTSFSEASKNVNGDEHTKDDSINVPIKHTNGKSFIESPNNSHNDIKNQYDIQSSEQRSSNSINEAVITRKKKIDSSNNYEEDIAYLSKRRIRRSTGFENQRFEVLTDKDEEEMSVVINNKRSLENITKPVIKAEKQTVTTYEIIDWEDVPESVRHHFRKKAADRLASSRNGGGGIRFGSNRRLKKEGIDKKKTTCMLYLQADHLFHEQMGYSEEASIELMTRHVQRVNSIYRPIDFDGDGKPDNISFMIKRIKVHTNESLNDPKYRFPGNYGVEKFLEIFSEENYDAFCLAYMFTFRDFEGGTLGLAWTGDLKNAGGVCEKNGHYRGSLKSLNTGIITLLNYGKHVPPAVSHVTMAHEMGHNFGSPHDPENNKACVPGGEDGNYIMFARATSGDKMNNRNFSPCSLKSVKRVLQAKARGSKGCFTEPKMALCGNGVVEEGEECDCGWEEDCEEECCWPQRTDYPKGQKPCTLRPNKPCSPTQGPCCSNDCSFKTGELKCRDNNGCRGESYCDGKSPECPMSELKPNKTVCNKEFVCYKGECTGSICLAYGMESCQCDQGPNDKKTKACELCCKLPGEGQECRSSFELNVPPYDVPDMFSKPGTPCKNYKGYCDVFQKCREVDPSGPLATLRNLLLGEESIKSLKEFLMTYWWSVIFIFLAVMILMVVIIKVCGKKTPFVYAKRRNRHKTFHHDVTEVPMGGDIEEGGAPGLQVHPTTVEASVPLGKKVRLGMGGKRDKKSKRRSRSKSKDKKSHSSEGQNHHRSDYFRRETGKTDENIAKATLLAANLSQLLVTLPPERIGQSSDFVTSESGRNNPSSSSKATTPSNAEKNQRSTQDSPSRSDVAALILDDGKNASIMQQNKMNRHQSKSNDDKNDSEHNARRRKANNADRKKDQRLDKGKLNPTDMLSKSFEKLDMINQRRERAKRARAKRHGAQSDDDSETHIIEDKDTERNSRSKESNRPRRIKSRDAKENDGKEVGKEVTIAKVGRFKFSLELNKKFEEETKEKEKRKHRSKHRSKSHSSRTPSKNSRKRRREKQAMELKDHGNDKNSDEDEQNLKTHGNNKYDNKEEQKNSKSSAIQRKSKSTVQAPMSYNKVPSVIVSKQRNHDRPLLLNENRRQRKSVPAMALHVKNEKGKKNESDSSDHEYEVIDICRAKLESESGDKFSRSISQPAEAVHEVPKIELLRGTTVCDPLAIKTNQNKGAALRIRKNSAPQNLKKYSVDSSQAIRQNDNKTVKVKRAETTKEKVSTRLGVSRKESLLLLPDNALVKPSEIIANDRLKPNASSSKNNKGDMSSFDNHAYDKSPEPNSDNHKKKLPKNRSGLLLHEESEEKGSSNVVEGSDEIDNLGEKLSRFSSLTLSSLNSTFHLNKRRADYSNKKKYHSVDSDSPTHHYDNIPLPVPLSKSDEDGSSTDASSGSSTSLTSPSTSSDSKRLSPQTQVHSLSEETNSITGESTSKLMEERVVNPPSSFSDKSNLDKSETRKLHAYGNQKVDDTVSSSSEYSTSSEEDTSTNDSESSSEEDEDTSNGISKTTSAPKQVHSLSAKPSMKEMGGISRAQILENVRNESIEDEENDDFHGIDKVHREHNEQPPDLSLAFIGCDNEGQFEQSMRPNLLPPPVLPTQTIANVNSRVAPNNIRRKTSSLSQRYGAVRRSTSRGSAAIEESKGREVVPENRSANNKSLELDDIQLDEYTNNSNPSGKPFSTKPQSPKFLRPQNKVILGDSSDNVSILTDGML